MRTWSAFTIRDGASVWSGGAHSVAEALESWAWAMHGHASFEGARHAMPGLELDIVQVIPANAYHGWRPVEVSAQVTL